VVALLLVLAPACGGGDGGDAPGAKSSPSKRAVAQDRADVLRTFDRYKAGILSQDGDAVAATLTESSVDRYEELRDLALDGAARDVRALPVLDRLTVAELRARLTVDQLEPLGGKELAALCVKEKIGPLPASGTSIGAVVVTADTASAAVRTDIGNLPGGLRFHYEDDVWRLDLPWFLGKVSVQLKTGAPGFEKRYLTGFVALDGKAVTTAIYDLPMR
jgi:hypothetical protein